jgi:hypothetical protein
MSARQPRTGKHSTICCRVCWNFLCPRAPSAAYRCRWPSEPERHRRLFLLPAIDACPHPLWGEPDGREKRDGEKGGIGFFSHGLVPSPRGRHSPRPWRETCPCLSICPPDPSDHVLLPISAASKQVLVGAVPDDCSVTRSDRRARLRAYMHHLHHNAK